jgi:hypothetical protein
MMVPMERSSFRVPYEFKHKLIAEAEFILVGNSYCIIRFPQFPWNLVEISDGISGREVYFVAFGFLLA